MRKYDTEKNESDCHVFMDYINDGKAEEAYSLFRQNPDLIEGLKIIEISDVIDEFRRGVGDRAVFYYLARTARCIKRISSEAAFSAGLDKAVSDLNLEEFLKGIDKKHKDLLDNMDDEG